MTTSKSRFARTIRSLLAATLAGGCLTWTSSAGTFSAGSASAQDDPFGGPAAAKPAAGGDGTKPAKSRALPIPDDPAAQTILASTPATPDEFVRAIRNLMDLGYPAHAGTFLDILEKTNPPAETWAEILSKYGSDFFLELSREKTLQPAGARVARTALKAADALAKDPTRIRQAIGDVNSPDEATRRRAFGALRQIGAPAIPLLIEFLADESRAADHRRVQAVLVELAPFAVEPLIGTLEAENGALRARAIETLTVLKSPRALGYLVRLSLPNEPDAGLRAAAREALTSLVDSPPDARDAEHYLRRRIGDLMAGTLPVPLGVDQRGELWHWDAAAKQPRPKRYHQRELCAVEAARLARELDVIAPDSLDARRVYLAARLEADKLLGGLDAPLVQDDGSAFAAAKQRGVAAVEDLLAEMLRRGRPVAAICAAEVLGEIGDAALVRSAGGTPRPLVQALAQTDRRLRFAALRTIIKLDPQAPFAGSNYVGESLAFLANSVGSRRVLVAHHRLEEARTLAGLLQTMGYQADTATTSRGVFLQATRQPDYEFALLSETLSGPSIKELLPQLRHDKKTASLPIGVLVNMAVFQEGGDAPPDVAAKKAEGAADADQGDEKAPMTDEEKTEEIRRRKISAVDALKSDPLFQIDATRRGSTFVDRTPTPIAPMIKVRTWTVGDEFTDAFPRPYDADGMDNVVRRLAGSAGRGTLPLEVRLEHATFALECLAKFADAEDKYGFYEAFRCVPSAETAVRTPELLGPAAKALGAFGTPKAQVALVDLISQNARPLDERQMALAAFRVAVARRSLRLTRSEILRQYERYNQSERLDADTQQVLGAVLDVIESVDAAKESSPPAAAAQSASASSKIPPHATTP